MKRKLELLLLVIFLMLASTLTARVWASPAARIALDPSSVIDVPSGETFTVDVMITDANNIYGWQIYLTFNPSVLNVAKVTEGPFLKSVNKTGWPTPRISNDKGYVMTTAVFWVPYPPVGASGSGKLANITFTVKSGGTSSLHFDEKLTKLKSFSVEGSTLIDLVNPYDFVTQDGTFRGVGGGVFGLPLEIIAGVVAVVVVAGVAGAFYLRRRRHGSG